MKTDIKNMNKALTALISDSETLRNSLVSIINKNAYEAYVGRLEEMRINADLISYHLTKWDRLAKNLEASFNRPPTIIYEGDSKKPRYEFYPEFDPAESDFGHWKLKAKGVGFKGEMSGWIDFHHEPFEWGHVCFTHDLPKYVAKCEPCQTDLKNPDQYDHDIFCLANIEILFKDIVKSCIDKSLSAN